MHSHSELVSEFKIKSHTKRFFAFAQNDGDNQTYRHTEALAEVFNKQNSNNRFFGRQLPQNDYTSALALNGTPLRSRPLLVQAQNDKQISHPELTERHPELYKAKRRGDNESTEPVCAGEQQPEVSGSESKRLTQRFFTFAQNNNNRKKAAFTLAEVLITLGIIGIVAALTMPGLMAKFRQIQFETAFKKDYSTIQNAIRFITEDENLSMCYVYWPKNMGYQSMREDCKQLKSSLVRVLRLSEYKNSERLKDKYIRKSEVMANGGRLVNGNCAMDSWLSSASAFITLHGAIYYINYAGFPNIVIDVNGHSGPNRWGYDVFYMVLSKHNDNIVLTDEYCSMIEKGGKLPRKILFGSNSFSYLWN